MHLLHVKPLRESLDSQHRAGRYNPATVIKIGKRRHVLPVGSEDNWDIYKEGERIYCVSWNTRLGYAGVQAYDAEDQEPTEEKGIFFQDAGDLLEKSDRTIANKLVDYLEEVIN